VSLGRIERIYKRSGTTLRQQRISQTTVVVERNKMQVTTLDIQQISSDFIVASDDGVNVWVLAR